MEIVICDDILIDRQTLREHIHRCGAALSLDYLIEEFENAEDLIHAVRGDKVHPDILFMDIYMGGMTGIKAARLLQTEGFSGEIIFTTTSRSHAVESYGIMAAGYLVKPYSSESFDRNFYRIIQNHTKNFKTISFPSDRLKFSVFLKDLEYIESNRRGSIVHVKGEAVHTSKPISTFVRELSSEKGFLPTHQSCIVNLHFVSLIQKDFVLMKSGAKAPLALRNYQKVLKAATDYYFLKMREDSY